MSDHQPTSRGSSQKGIDIRKALEILSGRFSQPDTEDHKHTEGCCGRKDVPPNAKSMGQTIDLLRENNATTTTDVEAAEVAEALQKRVQDERAKRKLELEKKLQAMTVKELLHAVFEAQQQRVRTYGVYDGGLEDVLQTGNMTNYPTLCAEATASFSVLSETIKEAQKVLQETHGRKDLGSLIAQLQSKERTKLNLTAALHLEKIRKQNQIPDRIDGPDRIAALLSQDIVSLQDQIRTSMEEINDVLDELRCALTEEDE